MSVAIPQDGGAVAPGILVGSVVNVPSAGQYELYFLYSLEAEQRTLSFVQQVLAAAAVGLVVLIGAMTFLVTRQAVRPVRSAARVAQRFADGHLSERIPVHGVDEMATLASSFNEMAGSLQDQISRMEEMSRMQRRFVSDVSHELRTPLTTIRMAAEVLHAARSDLEAGPARSAELLATQLDRFEDMLADLLEISRFDAGAAMLDAESVDVRDVVTATVEQAGPLAERKSVWLHVELPAEPVARRRGPAAGRARAAQPAGQRDRARRGPSGRGAAGPGRARARRRGARPRDRHDPGRGRPRVRPLLARRPGPGPDHRRHGARPGDLDRGRPPARRPARGLGRPGEGAVFRLTLPLRAGLTLEGSPLPLAPPREAGVPRPSAGLDPATLPDLDPLETP